MRHLSRKLQLIGFIGWLAAAFSAGLVGAVASLGARDFYGQLTRPSWAPPGWLFAPTWSMLYVLMAIAAWLVWRAHGFKTGRTALTLFFIQLLANALWTWLFFAWRQGAVAFVEILILWVLIVSTVVSFWRLKPLAGALMLPYLAWVSFASALNFAVWRLNVGVL